MQEDLSDVVDQLISDCGAIQTQLERIEHTAILNVVKWGLQVEIERIEQLKEALQKLATRLNVGPAQTGNVY